MRMGARRHDHVLQSRCQRLLRLGRDRHRSQPRRGLRLGNRRQSSAHRQRDAQGCARRATSARLRQRPHRRVGRHHGARRVRQRHLRALDGTRHHRPSGSRGSVAHQRTPLPTPWSPTSRTPCSSSTSRARCWTGRRCRRPAWAMARMVASTVTRSPRSSTTTTSPFAAAMFGETLALDEGATAWAEVRALRADGGYSWLEVSGVNLLADADVGAVVLTVRDVDDRRARRAGTGRAQPSRPGRAA